MLIKPKTKIQVPIEFREGGRDELQLTESKKALSGGQSFHLGRGGSLSKLLESEKAGNGQGHSEWFHLLEDR